MTAALLRHVLLPLLALTATPAAAARDTLFDDGWTFHRGGASFDGAAVSAPGAGAAAGAADTTGGIIAAGDHRAVGFAPSVFTPVAVPHDYMADDLPARAARIQRPQNALQSTL